jgi:uncharacterized protein YgbK (DUF1537 family)
MSQAIQRITAVSYYGDDFTGSTDVMEALASNGVDTVLFLNVPDADLLARFAHCKRLRACRHQPQRNAGMDAGTSHAKPSTG